MNGRELAFCAHYHVHRNAHDAAVAAGYGSPRSNAHAILRRPHVQEQLNFLAMQRNEVVALDGAVVVNELGAIALTRPDEFMKVVDGNWQYKRPEELNERQRACVKDILVRDVKDDDGVMRQEFKYVMHDKLSALYKLGDHFGIGGTKDSDSKNPFEDMDQEQLERLTNAMNNALKPKALEGEVA